MQNRWDPADTPRAASWQTPIDYPPELLARKGFTPTMVLALAAGLLSAVLTPCLLQLIVIYLATLTGLGAGELARPGAVPAQTARRMLCVALAFVGGFSALFTMAGAVIGYAGKEVQFGSTLMAAGFSLGCMTCFSGAIVATLLVYVGALGSAAVGAAVLFMFSLGVAIPFLLAALYLSRVIPAMTYLARHAPLLGLASMAIIIAFGLVLITDNFHVLSDAIYPFLGLS